MNRKILMFLYGCLDTDGRVLRCLSVLEEMRCHVTILTTESKKNFSSHYVNHIILNNNGRGKKDYISWVRNCLYFAKKHCAEYDAFYCQDYFSTLLGFLISRFTKKKIIYDAHELLLLQKGQKASLRDKAFIFFEKIFIRKAFYVIAANEERADILQKKYNLKNLTWVLNITDTKPLKNPEIKEFKTQEDYYMVYQGFLSEGRNISFFAKVLKVLPPNVKLMLIGGGDKDFYHKLVEELQLQDRVVITGRISNAEMMERLKDCHLGIISYPFSDLNNIYCSPNKIFEYAARYLPMISTNQPFLEKKLSKYEIGVTFKENDFDSFKQSFERIIDQNITSDMFDRFLADFNFKNEAKKIEMVINQI